MDELAPELAPKPGDGAAPEAAAAAPKRELPDAAAVPPNGEALAAAKAGAAPQPVAGEVNNPEEEAAPANNELLDWANAVPDEAAGCGCAANAESLAPKSVLGAEPDVALPNSDVDATATAVAPLLPAETAMPGPLAAAAAPAPANREEPALPGLAKRLLPELMPPPLELANRLLGAPVPPAGTPNKPHWLAVGLSAAGTAA
mmetsp:Transcript_17845/g.32336  ORF Transcript_17845/g.32336 Transcript_17845/m.32336 type:complete len:202 (+) Transcript_17845:1337-1942(+)